MHWNRFDIVEAYYLFFIQYHTGQNSLAYKRMSKMLGYFKPSPFLTNENSLSDNGLEIYNNLVAKETYTSDRSYIYSAIE